MNRSHLLPATLLALAAVAVAQSTQNQSNIARLVNVINQVTAKVDGVIPLREHEIVELVDEYDCNGQHNSNDWIVPSGMRAQLVGVYSSSRGYIRVEHPSGDVLTLHSDYWPDGGSDPDGRGSVLNEGDRVFFETDLCGGLQKKRVTFALEEI